MVRKKNDANMHMEALKANERIYPICVLRNRIGNVRMYIWLELAFQPTIIKKNDIFLWTTRAKKCA